MAESENIKMVINVAIVIVLIGTCLMPIIDAVDDKGTTYNIATHGKEQSILNKDFNWWIDYWEKYNCESCWIGLWDDNGVKKFRIVNNSVAPWQYYTVGYDPNFDMSYDSFGTWIIQFNATDGVAIGNNYLVSTNAPTKEYAREIVYNSDTTTSYIAGWYIVNDLDIGIWTSSTYSFDLLISQGTEVGDGYYSIVRNDVYDKGNYAELFFKVTDIGRITIGGNNIMPMNLVFAIPILLFAGLILGVARVLMGRD